MKISNTQDGWSYEALLNATGLSLFNVEHDGHPLLNHVHMLKTYAELKNDNGSTLIPYQLGTDGMQAGSNAAQKVVHDAIPGSRSPDYHHTVSSSIKAYFSIDDFGGGTGQKLIGKQYYAFTAPSDTPRHETTGFASAGRFYPSLDFIINARDEDEEVEYIDKLRFDYYFDLNINGGGRRASVYNIPEQVADSFGDVIEALVETADAISGNAQPKQRKQQAGFFQDLDTNPIRRTFLRIPGAGKHTFSYAEKPLIWEVVADGLLNGTPLPDKRGALQKISDYVQSKDYKFWDNIHAWGYNNNGLVSTPGMPYGFHLHWRWASSVNDKTSLVLGRWTQPLLGDPDLAGRDINNDPVFGGPLIDPRLPKQDIRVAFVKKSTAEAYAQETASSHDDFEEIFKRIKAKPDEIKDGEDCVFIMSIVVHRENPKKKWAGTIFPHGIFFPHEYNPPILLLLGLPFEFAYSEQYIPDKPAMRQWKRNPV